MNRQQIWKAAGLVVLFCGFARAGTFTPFDAPGAGTGSFQGTFSLAINPAGTITGFLVDANFVSHGFARANDGTITTFDAPDAVQGTFPAAIDLAGTITGFFVDADFISHGFVRATDGTIISFDAPDAGPIG